VALRCEWLDYCSSKNEVIRPAVAPRVEETDEPAGFGIEGSDIAPLPRIASKASISEVIEF
jgi:hypothetical protein